MKFDQGLGQRQAKAGPLVLAAELAVDLLEGGKRLRNVLRRNPNARIGDLKHMTTVRVEPGSYGDFSPDWRKLDSIR